MENKNRIQQLLEKKDFAALTPEEKNGVLQEMSREEYMLRRKIIAASQLYLAAGVHEAEPDPEILDRASAALKPVHEKTRTNGLMTLLTFRVPLFIPAAAAILLLVFLPFPFRHSPGEQTTAKVTDTVYKVVRQVDTIVMEKETVKKIPVVHYVTQKITSAGLPAGAVQSTDRVVHDAPGAVLEKTRTLLSQQENKTGISARDETSFRLPENPGDNIR